DAVQHLVLALFLQQRLAADRALLLAGRVPGDKVALGVLAAAVEHPALLTLALDDLPAALGALGAGVVDDFLHVFALGVARAGQKLAVAAKLDHHLAAALFADDVGLV